MPTARSTARSAALSALSAISALAVLLAPPSADAAVPGAADEPAVLTFDVDPTLPLQVGPTGYPEPAFLELDATEPVDGITVTAQGPGLEVSSFTEGTAGPDRPGSVGLEVAATTTGLHTLTVTASAPGATPATVRLPYVYRGGGGRLPGSDSLAGRAYAAQGDYTDYGGSEDGYGARYSSVITFVDDTYAVRGLPGHLATACGGGSGGAGGGCLPYAYDAATGLVQVGDYVIGQLGSGAAYLDGATPAVPRDTGERFDAQRYRRLVFASAGARYAGTWAYRSPYTQDGIYAQRLTLRGNGTYDLSVRAGVGTSDSYEGGAASFLRRDWSGRYRVGDGGRLTLRDARNRATYAVARMALGATDEGQAQPGRLGVELQMTLKVRQGPRHGTSIVDGNLLAPRP